MMRLRQLLVGNGATATANWRPPQQRQQPAGRRFRSAYPDTEQSVTVEHTITGDQLDQFARLTGDDNPIHNRAASTSSTDQPRLVHGAFLNGLVAGVIGSRLPGAGTVVLRQEFRFRERCWTGRPVECRVWLEDAVRTKTRARYECRQEGRVVFEGTAVLKRTKVVAAE